MADPLFAWLHLSDIHWGHGSEADRWDQKLVLDLLRKDAIGLSVPNPDVVLVTGDAAAIAEAASRAG